MPLTKVQSRGTENVGQGSSNVIINGAMNVSQRATSSTGLGASNGYFTVDRYKLEFNNTAGRLTMTQDSSAPSGFANSTKLACTTADTSIASDELLIFQQRIEGQNLQAFAKGTSDAKEFAVSFYVKGNASATYVAELYDHDNARQVGKTFSVTTDWTRIELIFPADTTGGFDDDNARSLDLNIWLHAGSNFSSGTLGTTWQATDATDRAVGASSFFSSTSNTFFITGIQIEVGSQASDFQHEDISTTLAKCQRYCFLFTKNSAEGGGLVTFANAYSTGSIQGGRALPVTMRAKPSATFTGNIRIGTGLADFNSSSTSVAGNESSINQLHFYIGGFSGLTQNQGYFGHMQTNGDTFVVSAEL